MKKKKQIVLWQTISAVLAILLVITLITSNLKSDDNKVVAEKTVQKAASAYTEGDLKQLEDFSSCLAEKGLKIYGADWCGWTKKLVTETLGGADIAGDAYVECTENKELCQSEGVRGYPTIKLNGEPYKGQRTLDSLGEETGCPVPSLEGGTQASGTVASCGG